eukprot:Gb_19879 [translate_table: standard]
MVRGAKVLARGVHTGTLYKLEESTRSDGYNSSIIGEDRSETKRNPSSPIEKTMLWHQRMGHIGEKGLRVMKSEGLCMEAAWSCWECLEWLSLVIALQLVTVAYRDKLVYELLEDLEGCMVKLLECLKNLGHRLGIVTSCSRFMVDGAPPLKILCD